MMLTTRRNAFRLAALAAPVVWTKDRAFGAEQITIADVGGAPAAAIRKAFYDPFAQAAGIRVVGVVHESDPTVQFKLLVDTRSFLWDGCMVTPGHVAYLSKPKDYLEPLNIAPAAARDLVPGMLTPNWLGFSVFSTTMAYRTDKFPGEGPKNWKDFWNVGKFPGRRSLYKGVNGTLEEALMADGVAAKDLYPLDVNRAFKKLEQIKKHVNVWWSSGAQNTQLLQSGEVDMADTWGARAFSAIDSGAPVKIVWSEGLYNTDGWSIPRGTPRADLARKFIEFCIKPEQQAIYSGIVANGPTNSRAFDFLPAERAAVLPTSAENIKGLAPVDSAWWATNRVKMVERFQDWLLS
jgi:putative spermidine/putrescine transport system substrate-binding protein